MESLNVILAKICFFVNQLKCLETGEILGPIQLFSHVLCEITHGNKNIDQLSIVQMAVDAGIMPITSSRQTHKNMTNVLKCLDNASVVQMVAFLTMFVRYVPEYFVKLYQQEPDGTLKKLNDISPASTNNRQEISILLPFRVVHFKEDSLDPSLRKKSKEGQQKNKMNLISQALKISSKARCKPGIQVLCKPLK